MIFFEIQITGVAENAEKNEIFQNCTKIVRQIIQKASMRQKGEMFPPNNKKGEYSPFGELLAALIFYNQ